MRRPPGRGSPGRAAGAGGAEVRLGTRWASTVATTATAALGVVLALFAASGPRVAVRHGEPVAAPQFASTETRAAPVTSAAERRPPARRLVPSHPALRPQSRPAGAAADDSPFEALARRNPRRPAGPEIIAVSSPAAGFGDKLTVRGHRLGGATRVLFIGAERGRAEARFVVWDDDHLIAAVPDLGGRRQEAAVAVLTGEGVAISIPAGASDDLADAPPRRAVRVVEPGTVFTGGGAPVGFVENNAAARAAAGKTLFVRRGGRLWGHGGGDCLVFCERGVVVRSDVAACDLVEVDFVNPCVVPSLFHYTGIPAASGAAGSPAGAVR